MTDNNTDAADLAAALRHLDPATDGGAGGDAVSAVELVVDLARTDGSGAFAVGEHLALRLVLGSEVEAGTGPAAYRTLPPVEGRLGLHDLPERSLVDVPEAAAARVAVTTALFDAAVATGVQLGSVEAAAESTRRRGRPRPVPGLTSSTADPFAQTLLGEGLGNAWAARASVRDAALAVRGAVASDDHAAWERAEVAVLGALEVALSTAVQQGDRVWQVVGTSGSARADGFDRAWRDARALSLLHREAVRRRRLGQALVTA